MPVDRAIPTNDRKGPAAHARWLALWTHSHCERLVEQHLIAKGFDIFLPMMTTWSQRGGVRHPIVTPMFPGYLFVRHVLNRESYIKILETRGVVRILGERWDRPAVVDDAEMEAIQRVLRTELPVFPHPYLREGQRVQISCGPLAGVEGLLVQIKPTKDLLVLSVELLLRSVAVEVDCRRVAPIDVAAHGSVAASASASR